MASLAEQIAPGSIAAAVPLASAPISHYLIVIPYTFKRRKPGCHLARFSSFVKRRNGGYHLARRGIDSLRLLDVIFKAIL